jgi:hypothetical protein
LSLSSNYSFPAKLSAIIPRRQISLGGNDINITELKGKEKEVGQRVREVGQQATADFYGVKRSSLRDYLYRNDLPTKKDSTVKKAEQAGLTVKPDSLELTTPAHQTDDFDDPDQIVRDRGLNPEDWVFEGLVDNYWDSPTGERLYQRKLTLKRRKASKLILPARTDGPTFEAPKAKKIKPEGSLFIVKGDEQAPFYDKPLHEAYCTFLADNDINTIIDVGDGMDLPDISKYKGNPEHDAEARVNDCITTSYELRRDERVAAPDARILEMPGNHDIRLRDFIINNVPELHGLKRAQIEGNPEESVFNIGYLKRLDELGVEWLETDGPYEHGEFKISNKLAVRHGYKAVKDSGRTAFKTLEDLGYSILIGHVHRLAIVYKTVFDIDGNPTVLAGAETGCMCQVDITGLGYQPAPDWQPGFMTATVFPDGTFALEPAVWVNGKLLWRDKRY